MTTRGEMAPMLARVWGHIAPTIAQLIVAKPDLAHRLTLAPSRVIHAVAVYVGWAVDDGWSTSHIADAIDREDARGLLARAIPDAHPRLFRLLDKVSGRVRDREFYVSLNTLLNGPAASFLLECANIDTRTLLLAEQLVSDRVLWAARRAIGQDTHRARAVAGTLALLRSLGIARDIETLPTGAGWPAIRRRIESDFGRMQVPPAPFSAPVGWRQVGDVQTLQHFGKRMGNCVAHLTGGGIEHYRRLIAGETVLLASESSDPMIAEVERIAATAWRLANILGAGNHRAPDEVTDNLAMALSNAMKAAGHVLLKGHPLFDLESVVGFGTMRDEDLRWLEA